MKYVISLGGSIIVPDEINVKLLLELKEIIHKSKHEFVIVCGGGQTARKYMNSIKGLVDEMSLDEVGIASTHLNAVLVSRILKARVIKSLDEVTGYNDKVLVSGGFMPGITTDTDAVIIAEKLGVKIVINISNVKGVYDKNPKKNPEAKMYKKLDYEGLITLSNKYGLGGKADFVFDLAACKLAQRTKTKIIFIKGIDNFKKIIENKTFEGTVVE